jgi:hypothetical protein
VLPELVELEPEPVAKAPHSRNRIVTRSPCAVTRCSVPLSKTAAEAFDELELAPVDELEVEGAVDDVETEGGLGTAGAAVEPAAVESSDPLDPVDAPDEPCDTPVPGGSNASNALDSSRRKLATM